MNKIITVGREFGSGGRELGRGLAEELGIEYYDKEIISEIAKNTSLSESTSAPSWKASRTPSFPSR